jgi:hypothetical protein
MPVMVVIPTNGYGKRRVLFDRVSENTNISPHGLTITLSRSNLYSLIVLSAR